MPAFLITYDLRKQRNYQPLYDLLRQWKAARLLESVWLAELAGPAATVRDLIRQRTDADDAVAVIELKAGFNWATIHCEPAGNQMLKRISP